MYYILKSCPKTRTLFGTKKAGKYWVNLGDKAETSTRGRLLQLLPKIENADLRKDVEETLKKMT